jgi:hypothetical protein
VKSRQRRRFNDGSRSGLREPLRTRHGDLHGYSAFESQLRGFFGLVGGNYNPAVLGGHHLDQLGGVAFHGEIQIANRESAQHVAHRSAGEVQAQARGGRGRLHLAHHPKLFPGQVAFQHEHVIAHSVLAFSPNRMYRAG